ncbi:hypothetical protein MKZ38_004999 [Zalerion maritima]|uniref:Uncharacterized protein n=1 Tax=Zalerion maritima TaxID=339359 RepID=A0AAD5RL93_9PEZI|nr:hypothetical protein MKZ38_004999 [Zalerion maritima]
MQNILEDGEEDTTAVIDWEFLQDETREEESLRDSYAVETNKKLDDEDKDGDDLDSEGKNGLFWIHLLEYKKTRLEKVSHARMKERFPDWDLQIEEDALRSDFLKTIHVA